MTPTGQTDPQPRAPRVGLSPFARFAKGFDLWVTRVTGAALWLGIACLTLLLIVVLLQVIAGLASSALPQLSRSMSASWEIAGFLMGAGFVLAMPATLRAGGHIRVTLLRDNLGDRAARVADMLSSAAILAVLTLLAAGMAERALSSLHGGSVSTASLTPLWIPEAAFAIAFALFALQALARLLSLLTGQEAESPRDLVGAPME